MRKLSVITINYNNCEGLRRTIESVINQKWHDFEYIIIDGGSTDGSRELIELYKEHLSYWCSEPDKGIYNAMNKGVRHAKGEYLNFMNSGDTFYDNEVLQKVFKEDSKSDIISGQVVWMNTNNLIREYGNDIVALLIWGTLNHQGSFIRRQLLVDMPYDEKFMIVSDWKFWLEAILIKNRSFQIIDDIVAMQEPLGVSSNSDIDLSKLHIQEKHKVLDDFFPPLIKNALLEYREIKNDNFFQSIDFLRDCHFLVFRIIRKITVIVASILGFGKK